MMEKTLTFSTVALEKVTPKQWLSLHQMLLAPSREVISVMLDFSLPAGYIAFNDGRVYGGIDPDGGIST